MHQPNTPRRWGAGPLQNAHGVAFLLSVYFFALVMLLLGGVSLQRTTTEVRAAQLSRELQQAFWLAEAGMDHAINRLGSEYLQDTISYGTALERIVDRVNSEDLQDTDTENPSYTVPTPYGTATFTLATIDSAIVSPDTQRLTRQITATGLLAGRSSQVSAVVAEDKPLRGLWVSGPIFVGMHYNPIRLQLDLRSGRGTAGAIFMNGSARHDGALQIGYPEVDYPWQRLIGPDGATDGVVLSEVYAGSWEDTPECTPCGIPTTTSAAPAMATMQPFPPVAVPYTAEQCSQHLRVDTLDTTVSIPDGDPMDLSGPEDGQIVLCVQSVVMPYRSHLIFQAPTKIYVVGTSDQRGENEWAFHTGPITVADPIHVVPDAAEQISNGLKLFVRPSASARAGSLNIVNIMTNRFSGSIYAPSSRVTMILTYGNDEDFRVGHIVADKLDIAAFGVNPRAVSLISDAPLSTPVRSRAQLLNWTIDR